MKYGIIIKQQGDGCDYTIGCGLRFHVLKAKTLEIARKEAKRVVQGKKDQAYKVGFEDSLLFDDFERSHLESVTLVEVVEDLPLEDWVAEAVDYQARSRRSQQEAEERAAYERLRKKFEG